MHLFVRIVIFVSAVALLITISLTQTHYGRDALQTHFPTRQNTTVELVRHSRYGNDSFDWEHRKENYPVERYHPLPAPALESLPKVQYDFSKRFENGTEKATRRQRMAQGRCYLLCWCVWNDG